MGRIRFIDTPGTDDLGALGHNGGALPGCTWNRLKMLSRMLRCRKQGVPITN
ncbi:MAG: hypothetical protein KAQ78_09175 [Candidatus Latescibacteria bacterium]|nr:hypothetical protein [Candidatus Latescibacterota bacterium]